jgi:hypothetical protein
MNEGWKCPSCGRCFAPTVKECPYCVGHGVKQEQTPPVAPSWQPPWHPWVTHKMWVPIEGPQCSAMGAFECKREVIEEVESER